MKARAFWCMAGVFVLIAYAPSRAARPFETDDAGTVEAGTYEFEAAADYWDGMAQFGLCLKHGVTTRMDLGVAVGRSLLPEDERGYHGAEIGLKFGLVPDLLAVSVAGSFGTAEYGANLIFSEEIGIYSVHANAGYTAVPSTSDVDVTYGLVNEFAIGRVSLGVDIGGCDAAINRWLVGGRVAPADWIALDAGIGGDFEDAESFAAITGVWLAFPISKE